MIIVEAVNNALTSHIKLCNYAILNLNKPIKVAHLQKSANLSMLNGAVVIGKWLSYSFSESKKTLSLDKVKNT